VQVFENLIEPPAFNLCDDVEAFAQRLGSNTAMQFLKRFRAGLK
jgi:hypothetical protein